MNNLRKITRMKKLLAIMVLGLMWSGYVEASLERWQCNYDINKSISKDKRFSDLNKISIILVDTIKKDWVWQDHQKHRMFFVKKSRGQYITISPRPSENTDYYYMVDFNNKTYSMSAYKHKSKPRSGTALVSVVFNCMTIN